MRFLGIGRRDETEAGVSDRAAADEAIRQARADWDGPRTGDGRTTTDDPPVLLDEPPAPDPVADSGVHAREDLVSAASVHKMACTECGGQGYVFRTTGDLLQESLSLIPEGGADMVIKEFYTRLLNKAPGLADLFPADLLIAATGDRDSRGYSQRDKLYQALNALAVLYDPDDERKMERLDTALGAFGRSHALFYRPSEDAVRGATLEEYAAVKATLFETFGAVAGEAWRTAYTTAWSEAYDYAAAAMMREQHLAGMRAPRFPRAGS